MIKCVKENVELSGSIIDLLGEVSCIANGLINAFIENGIPDREARGMVETTFKLGEKEAIYDKRRWLNIAPNFTGKMLITPINRSPFEVEADWAYNPETKCWYGNGSSYPAEICRIKEG